MTKFSFEVPIAHLEDFESSQDFHFALSHLCRQSKLYLKFFQEQVSCCLKPVWLDNSFNELGKPDTPSTLVKIAQELRPHLVICPDSPKWEVQKIKEAYETMLRYYPPLGGPNLMVVVKDEGMYNYMRRVGVVNFAIAYRVRIGLPDLYWAKGLHYLGMNSATEIRQYQPPSCDTALPIKLALQGVCFTDWMWNEDYPHDEEQKKESVRKKEYFQVRMKDKQIDLALNNIRELKEVCNELGRHED